MKTKITQRTGLNPLTYVALFLSLIGRPFYFILSRLMVTFLFIFFIVGRLIHLTYSFVLEALSNLWKKIRSSKKRGSSKAKAPKLRTQIQLEKLRISLFEVKIFSKLKKIFKIRISRFQKLRLKKRIFLIAVLFGFITLILISYFSIFKGLPSPRDLTKKEPQVSTKIYDRNGNLLYKIYKNENRTIVPLQKIPPHVRLATLAAEDAEFYSHPGFSVRGIFRALVQDIQTGSSQGGSTITQQLVKNVLLSPEKKLTRKIKELILSVEVEAAYSKDQIFEMYLNEVPYGGTAYGIEEASESYFGKHVSDLTLAEAAYLAGLTKSPTLYSPYGQNPELGFQRQKEVLDLMVINKFITKDQENEATQEKLTFVPNKTEIKAPHFVMYVRQLLVDKYGEDVVEKGGLEVTTSLDLSIQDLAQQVVTDEVDKLSSLHVGNGDALVLNPQTGEILAMVGSKDYFDTVNDGQVNVTLQPRQPGSSIKVVNYSYALSHGFTPATILDDSKVTFVVPGQSPYTPVDYDGTYRGKISLRSALAESRNIPAVRVLASYGVDNMITQGQKMGITTWDDPSRFGLSLTLGGGEVKLIDLASVYATLANYGKKPEVTPILQVKNYKGEVLESRTNFSSTQVIDPRIAYVITDILKDNSARAPAFGLASALVIPNHPEVAVKTGTSNDLKDNLAAGYNQDYLVVTWVGNNDGSPMSRIASGVTGASPIWNKIMSAILADKPSVDWKTPDGISKINICSLTATLPCDSCPTKQEWFLDENRPTKACSQNQIDKSKILNGASTSR